MRTCFLEVISVLVAVDMAYITSFIIDLLYYNKLTIGPCGCGKTTMLLFRLSTVVLVSPCIVFCAPDSIHGTVFISLLVLYSDPTGFRRVLRPDFAVILTIVT